jgi:hypothetical protein
MMTKVKTSIYIDREAWERFKRYASRRGVDASSLLEEIIMDEDLAEALNEAVSEISPSGGYELDFEPVEPREGPISGLIRDMRDERTGHIPRQ